MKTLSEHNKQRRESYNNGNTPCKNGIACPECNAELFDSNPSITLTAFPPMKQVHCDKCGYEGTRLC